MIISIEQNQREIWQLMMSITEMIASVLINKEGFILIKQSFIKFIKQLCEKNALN